ncbi:hypothetical protein [Corallococcus macrosporus]|uniref:Tail protein n=1 Tax=Corallococcus macrosporus DSM 14697 TaxID=1189310 RepID=A0A250JR36_9BACT|nr:hypothetical protein [Corallococcus macrosporus]ATB45942.1 tail protein [Corallococcus macrosporus DSM 14697]
MATVELPALYVDTVSLFAETRRPLLLNRAPGPEEADVPVDAALELELVDVGADGIARATTRVWGIRCTSPVFRGPGGRRMLAG